MVNPQIPKRTIEELLKESPHHISFDGCLIASVEDRPESIALLVRAKDLNDRMALYRHDQPSSRPYTGSLLILGRREDLVPFAKQLLRLLDPSPLDEILQELRTIRERLPEKI